MPYPELKALLTDIGVEELGHLEIIGTIVHQLTRSMTPEEIKKAGYEPHRGTRPVQNQEGREFEPRRPPDQGRSGTITPGEE